MKFDSDLDLFFDDFAVDAVLVTGETIKVIFDEPDQESLSLINSVDAQIKGKTSDFLNLKEKDEIQIEGVNYSVKNKKKIEDGLLSIAYLSKV